MKTALGIRFYEENPDKLKELEKLVREAEKSVDLVYVVINGELDKTGAYEYINSLHLPKTKTFLMNFWGKFTPALNAVVYNTTLEHCTHLFFCSPEVGIDSKVFNQLLAHMDDETLVVGARFDGQEFKPGINIGTGLSIPWNTLCVWNLHFLQRTGFLLVGDAPFDPVSAGIEELTTCAVQQKLYPNLKIKLVDIPGIEWNTEKLGEKRKKLHLKKLETKYERGQKQLEFMQLDAPKVMHIS